MPTIALISDIHANLEALEAVFLDIDRHPEVEAVYCLGDVVGYGPDPEPVIDLLEQRCAFVLLGNHDYALLTGPVGFNPVAAQAIACQRSSMEPGIFSLPTKKHRWDFLRALPEERRVGKDLFVHASPTDKIFEYILPEDTIYHHEKLEKIFAQIGRRCFVGHTHRPGVITSDFRWIRPTDLEESTYRFEGDEKLVVNVSSVGQPRDRDPRACYALLRDESLEWRRIAYDIEKTNAKVRQDACLHDLCGTRLLEGR
jgi:diadenosine tetraphosphatase ApaH/serine/threonine PP2A family protein phosphatase